MNLMHETLVTTSLCSEPHKNNTTKTLEAVFRRLHEKGLAMNKSKYLFNQTTIEFFGLVFSSEGVSPDQGVSQG